MENTKIQKPLISSKTSYKNKELHQFLFEVRSPILLDKKDILLELSEKVFCVDDSNFAVKFVPIDQSAHYDLESCFESPVETRQSMPDSYFGTGGGSGMVVVISVSGNKGTISEEKASDFIIESINKYYDLISDRSEYLESNRLSFKGSDIFNFVIPTETASALISEKAKAMKDTYPDNHENRLADYSELFDFIAQLVRVDDYDIDDIELTDHTDHDKNEHSAKVNVSIYKPGIDNSDYTFILVFKYNSSTGELHGIELICPDQHIYSKVNMSFRSYYIDKCYYPLLKESYKSAQEFLIFHKTDSGKQTSMIYSGVLEISVAKRLSKYIDEKFQRSNIEVVPFKDVNRRFIWNNKKDEPYYQVINENGVKTILST